MASLAIDLLRRERRRLLQERAPEGVQRGVDGLAAGQHGIGRRADRAALSVRTTASYDLSLPLRNCASRVARPSTSASTPVAAGSSVPVWPMRRSASARRTRATTSCDVGPAGLSTTNRPSINRDFDFLDEGLLQRVDCA
jgi:hypothetical protein